MYTEYTGKYKYQVVYFALCTLTYHQEVKLDPGQQFHLYPMAGFVTMRATPSKNEGCICFVTTIWIVRFEIHLKKLF